MPLFRLEKFASILACLGELLSLTTDILFRDVIFFYQDIGKIRQIPFLINDDNEPEVCLQGILSWQVKFQFLRFALFQFRQIFLLGGNLIGIPPTAKAPEVYLHLDSLSHVPTI